MGPPSKRQRISGPSHPRDQLDREASIREGPLHFAKDDILDEPKLEIRDGRLVHGRRRPRTGGERQPLLQRRQDANATDLTVVVSSAPTVTIDVSSAGDVTAAAAVPTVPSVPAFPSDLTVPSVPAVPTVPSVTLPTVPAVPQTGTGSTTLAETTAGATNSQQVLASPPATPLPGSSSATITSPLASASGAPTTANSTLVTSSSHSTTFLSTHHSTSLTVSSSLQVSNSSTTLSSSSTTTLSSSTTSSSSSSQSSSTSSSSSATEAFGAGATGAAGGSSGQSGSGSSGSGSTNGSKGSSNTPGSVIAGAVTGSVGAVAILLILAWLFLRWYKRRASRRPARLPGDSATSLGPPSDSTANMSQRHGLLPAGFMSRISRENRISSPTIPESERGFQKLAGRKVQSQFDDKYEGPMSRDFEAERQQQHQSVVSDTSFYRSSYSSTGEGPSNYDPTAKETLMPSPARTPVVHSGVSSQDFAQPPGTSRSTLSPPATPHTTRTFDHIGRSHQDGSRSSRFTEEV